MPFSLNNYSEFKKIADGGMSKMFRAVERSTNRGVMIKKMALDPAHRSFSLNQFQNQIRNASFLVHANIITIIDHGNDIDNFYVVMEYVDGCDFNKLISDSSFNPKLGLMIVLKALQALRFSHQNGLIHGNIKPANLLIDKTGRVVLTDFGVSQIKAHGLISQNGHSDFTTPLFISPEQTNLVAQQAGLERDVLEDKASTIYNNVSIELPCAISKQGLYWDLWSVGVLLYRVCSGYYPFYDNDLAKLLTSIRHSEPTKILDLVKGLPHPIAAVIEQCLQKEPNERPNSIDPIISILQQYFTSQGVSDIDGIIAAYMRDKMRMPPISEIPDTLSDHIFPAEQMTIMQNESEWEYREYKTIQSVPQLRAPIKPATEVEAGTTPFPSPRSRFIRPMIVLMMLVFLVVLGTFIFKRYSQKPHQLTSADSTNIESTYFPAAKPEVRVENPTIVPIQDSVMNVTEPAVAKALPDSRTKTNPLPAHINQTKQSQTRKQSQARKQSQSTTDAAALINSLMSKTENLPGVFKVTINPPEAQVFINGTLMSQNEMTNGMRITPGSYSISAKATGYLPHERSILIESNKILQLSLELKSNVKGNGQLHIYSYPWANLYIDDELIGTTPTPSPISLVEGKHRVVLTRDGYEPHEEMVIIENGGVLRLQLQLKKKDSQ